MTTPDPVAALAQRLYEAWRGDLKGVPEWDVIKEFTGDMWLAVAREAQVVIEEAKLEWQGHLIDLLVARLNGRWDVAPGKHAQFSAFAENCARRVLRRTKPAPEEA